MAKKSDSYDDDVAYAEAFLKAQVKRTQDVTAHLQVYAQKICYKKHLTYWVHAKPDLSFEQVRWGTEHHRCNKACAIVPLVGQLFRVPATSPVADFSSFDVERHLIATCLDSPRHSPSRPSASSVPSWIKESVVEFQRKLHANTISSSGRKNIHYHLCIHDYSGQSTRAECFMASKEAWDAAHAHPVPLPNGKVPDVFWCSRYMRLHVCGERCDALVSGGGCDAIVADVTLDPGYQASPNAGEGDADTMVCRLTGRVSTAHLRTVGKYWHKQHGYQKYLESYEEARKTFFGSARGYEERGSSKRIANAKLHQELQANMYTSRAVLLFTSSLVDQDTVHGVEQVSAAELARLQNIYLNLCKVNNQHKRRLQKWRAKALQQPDVAEGGVLPPHAQDHYLQRKHAIATESKLVRCIHLHKRATVIALTIMAKLMCQERYDGEKEQAWQLRHKLRQVYEHYVARCRAKGKLVLGEHFDRIRAEFYAQNYIFLGMTLSRREKVATALMYAQQGVERWISVLDAAKSLGLQTTALRFTNFFYAYLYLAKDGLVIDSHTVYPNDDFLSLFLPEKSRVVHFGFDVSKITSTTRLLNGFYSKVAAERCDLLNRSVMALTSHKTLMGLEHMAYVSTGDHVKKKSTSRTKAL